MRTLDVVGFGAINLDEILRVSSILPDSETVVEEYESVPGGSATNTIYALARLGVETGFIGAIGTDENSRILVQDLQQGGVDATQIKVKRGCKSGRVIAVADRYGRRALFIVDAGANSALSREDVNLDYARAAKFIHLSSFVGDAQLDCQKWLVDRLPVSTRISFAPGAIYAKKGLDRLAPVLQKTHVLFGNQHEIEELTGAGYREGARHLIRMGCKMVAVTTPSTSHVADARGEYTIRSSLVGEPADTTGAGDAYAAGFLYGLLKGKEPEECGQLGGLVARFCIARLGARAGLPTEAQLLQAQAGKQAPLQP